MRFFPHVSLTLYHSRLSLKIFDSLLIPRKSSDLRRAPQFAYLLYFVFIVGLLFIVWRILTERQRLKFEAEQEHREAERMQQVDALKTKFFTNISHEFRTPLSLIIAPLDKIIKKTRNEDQRNHLILVQRNARRLLAMVNQVLDFRRMELQKIEVNNGWGDFPIFSAYSV